MMYHLFQNSIWKVVKIAKTYDITLVGDAYFLPPLYYYIRMALFRKKLMRLSLGLVSADLQELHEKSSCIKQRSMSCFLSLLRVRQC